MTTPDSGTYHHTQRGWWWVPVAGFGLLMLALGFLLNEPAFLKVLFPIVGTMMVVLAAACVHLTVADQGDHLAIRFGPLPLLATRVFYPDILSAEPARTTLLDGWGIHLSHRGGWTWNVWGYDCVAIRRAHSATIWLGTDEPEALAAFLRWRIGTGH